MSAELNALVNLGRAVRDHVINGRAAASDWTTVVARATSDLQYGIDRFSESRLLELVRNQSAALLPLLLKSEGLPPDGVCIGEGSPTRLLLVDPIDGTRGLMHDKRSAFFLAGIAPIANARLSTLSHAVMVEIPTTRSVLSDVLAADSAGAMIRFTEHLKSGARVPLSPAPSTATDLRHGFATVVRFFAGAAAQLGHFHDQLLRELHPDDPDAWQDAFEDQYISSGGQMHSLITGRDRFVADLRPVAAAATGIPIRCAHPYDMLGLLVARACGVAINDPFGAPLDAPLDLITPVAWLGFANPTLRDALLPSIQRALTSSFPSH